MTPDDGTALRDAVEAFWQRGDEDSAIEVYGQVRQVQSERWLQVEAKHGKVSHYFDDFGQIKPRYEVAVPTFSRSKKISPENSCAIAGPDAAASDFFTIYTTPVNGCAASP